ncbi:MAG: HD domain-containing protein [Anaerolineales bacterium]|nr:HD domain-containing protein [Anaerolineales bacterium]
MVTRARRALSRTAAIGLISLWIAAATLGVLVVPGLSGELREMIAYSQILPILISAFYFGQAGGLLVAFAASLVSGSLVIQNMTAVNTIFVQRIMFQIASYNGVALLTSFLSEQEKAHRRQVARQLERITALRAIDKAITSGSDLSATLFLVLESLTRLLEAEAAVIYWRDPHTDQLAVRASLGFFGDVSPLTLGYAEQAAREMRTIHLPDLAERNPDFAQHVQGKGLVAYYAVPLIAQESLKGVLEIYDRASHPDETWRNDLEALAGQAAIAIVQSRLLQDLKDSNTEMASAYEATLRGWSRALDLRDRETEGHTQRVVAVSLRLAERMGVTGEQLRSFQRGALLHDIGKMGVPDSILLKPGPLDESEWAVMRRHPVYAQRLLAPIRYLEQALVIPLYHHERWDGSGYPFGLRGTDIPIEARIFAVVDVWDALSSDRPYRRALSPEACLCHIRDHAGTLFDPDVVAAFVALLTETESRPALTAPGDAQPV